MTNLEGCGKMKTLPILMCCILKKQMQTAKGQLMLNTFHQAIIYAVSTHNNLHSLRLKFYNLSNTFQGPVDVHILIRVLHGCKPI